MKEKYGGPQAIVSRLLYQIMQHIRKFILSPGAAGQAPTRCQLLTGAHTGFNNNNRAFKAFKHRHSVLGSTGTAVVVCLQHMICSNAASQLVWTHLIRTAVHGQQIFSNTTDHGMHCLLMHAAQENGRVDALRGAVACSHTLHHMVHICLREGNRG